MSRFSVLWGRGAQRWSFRAVFLLFLGVAFLSYGIPLWYDLQGQRILIVTSGSMARQPDQPVEPGQFNAGDAVVITPIAPTELQIGQVVTYWDTEAKTVTVGDTEVERHLTTHRIIDLVKRPQLENNTGAPLVDRNDNAVMVEYIRTKGDSNRAPDPNLTPVSNVRGVVAGVKPGWGYFLGYAHSPIGRFLVFAPALILLLAAEMLSWRRRPEPEPLPSRPTRGKRDALATPA